MIINAAILPEPLFSLVQTEKVRVHENNGIITMTPIKEDFDCTAELYRICRDGKLTLDKFLEWKHAEP